MVSKNARGLPVVMNNACTPQNIAQVFAACNGAVIGTHLRKDFDAARPFGPAAVAHFMAVINQNR